MFGTVYRRIKMKLSPVIGFLCLLASVISGCAKIGSPVGGPKDVTPPKVVSSKPEMNATNFSGKRVEITFDEFLKFKDKDKYFLTSPPFKKKPEVVLKYKTVVVDFQEPLVPNTTYSLNFGSSITDNNEGNPIRDFEFVFSTGNHIDSLSFEGKIENAFDHKPDKDGLFVMLYDVFGDSVPMKYLPAYASKTNEKGFFRINHLRADTFMVVAFKDGNSNLLLDNDEDVAFSDSLLVLNSDFYHAPDTLAAKDTTTSDSAYYSRFKPQMVLYSFPNGNKKQYLVKKERKNSNQLVFNFNAPLDTFRISLLNQTESRPWYLKEESRERDSIDLWITDSLLYKKDTIPVVLVYSVPDSSGILLPRHDTISLVYKPTKEVKKKDSKKQVEVLSLTSNAKEGFDLNNIIKVEANAPIDFIDTGKILFKYTEDTIFKPVKYILHRDTMFRKFNLDFKPIAGAQYSLIFDSLAVRSIYNTYNDSVGLKFRAQKDDYYGAIRINLTNVKGNLILQLLDDKEKLIKSQLVKEDKLVVFDFLAPGKYMVKAIFDRNVNSIWDPGNFLKKVQPEKVEYYPEVRTVRSNWDDEFKWGLGTKEKL